MAASTTPPECQRARRPRAWLGLAAVAALAPTWHCGDAGEQADPSTPGLGPGLGAARDEPGTADATRPAAEAARMKGASHPPPVGAAVGTLDRGAAHEDDDVARVHPALLAEYPIAFAPLPRHTYAYNPALLEHQGHLVSVVRLETLEHGRGRRLANRLGAQVIGAEGQSLSRLTVLATPKRRGEDWTAEDPRLVRHLGAMWVVYNRTTNGHIDGPRRVHLARLVVDGEEGPPAGWSFRLVDDRPLDFHLGPGAARHHEKNWSPFVFGRELCFLYESSPIVPICLDAEALADDAPRLTPQRRGHSAAPATWAWGAPRGGTPADFVPELDRFVTFFHSHKVAKVGASQRRRHYFTGAYSFFAAPPFAVDKSLPGPISSPLWLADRDTAEWHIAFATGAVWQDERVLVALGRNDRESSLWVLSRRRLVAMLAGAGTEGAGGHL